MTSPWDNETPDDYFPDYNAYPSLRARPSQAYDFGFMPPEPRRPRYATTTCVSLGVPIVTGRVSEFTTCPQALFRPEGLQIFGATAETLVHDLKVGNQTQFRANSAPVPGLFFAHARTFDEFFAELAKEVAERSPNVVITAEMFERHHHFGFDLSSDFHSRQVPIHHRFKGDTAEIGNNLRLLCSGPVTHAVLWGLTVR